MPSSSKKHARKPKVTDNQRLNLSSTIGRNPVNTHNKEFDMHKKFNNESTLSTITPQNNLMDPQIHHQNQRPQYQNEIPQIQQLIDEVNNNNNNNEQVIENFLENNWEMGEDFFIEQSRHFDVPSLLTCLYRLKTENLDLDDELTVLIRRRTHLLAEHRQNLASQNDNNCTQSTAVTNNFMELSLQNHLKPNKHTIPTFPNNIPSQEVFQESAAQGPRQGDSHKPSQVVFQESAAQGPRQGDQNAGVLCFNRDQAIAQKSSNMANYQCQSENLSSDSTTVKSKNQALPNNRKKSKKSRRNRKRGKKVENKSLTGEKQQNLEDSESKETLMATYQKNKNVMSISKSENDHNPKDEPIDLTEMADRNAPSIDTSIIRTPLHYNQVPITEYIDNDWANNGLNLLSTVAQHSALHEKIKIHKKVNEESSLLNNRSGEVLMAPQIHRQNQRPQNLPKTLQIQESASSSSINGVNYHNTKVLKDNVDKHWKEGGLFLIDEAHKFDVASLFTYLYELKSENVELEDKLDAMKRYHDKLLAENMQYKTSIRDRSSQRKYQNHSTPNGHLVHRSSNNTHSQAVSQDSVEVSRLNNRRPNIQNMRTSSSNPLHQTVAQQSLNITLPPIRQTKMNNQKNED